MTTESMKSILVGILFIAISNLLSAQAPFEKQFFKPLLHSSTDKAQPMYNSLMDKYDVKFYKLEIDSVNILLFLKACVSMKASVVNEPLDTFVLGLKSEYTVDSVIINGARLPFTSANNEIQVPINPALHVQDDIESKVYYHGSISEGGTGFFSGISYSLSNNIIYTLSEPLYATDWFPCKQVLTDKADSVYVFVTTTQDLKVGSNGLLTNTVNLGNGMVRYEWKSKYPIAYYLISMTIGDYEEYNIYAHPAGITDSILIQNYVYNDGSLTWYKSNIDETVDIMEAYCDLFGMYPFRNEKYGHCMAPIGGGMEHQTMTTISSFNFELISHELAHMWFGDYVTCATWQDIFINEGFATYSHLLALEYKDGFFPEDIMMGYHSDQYYFEQTGSIFIPEAEFDIDYNSVSAVSDLSSRIFSWGLSYQKGAIILHMLRYELQNDEIFFRILKDFLTEYQHGTALGTDFKEVVEDVSGKDFTDFFNQWYFGEGFPRYNISWYQDNGNVYIESVQSKSTLSAPFFQMHMDYLFTYFGGDTTIRLEQTSANQIYKIPLPELVYDLTIDPNHWVLAEIENITHEIFTESKDSDIDKLQLYPNPFRDEINLETEQNACMIEISIYNLSGKLVMHKLCESGHIAIDVRHLQRGMYYMNIRMDNVVRSQKLIKY
jgi:aminopeptidase N